MNPTAGQLLKERNRFPANTVAALADGRVVDLHTPITPPVPETRRAWSALTWRL